VAFYLYSNGIYQLTHRCNSSNAAEAADFWAAGLPDTVIIPIETQRKIKSKAYTALDVKAGSTKRHGRIKSLTIYTQGPHAREFISFAGLEIQKMVLLAAKVFRHTLQNNKGAGEDYSADHQVAYASVML
jgi:hypothetical protein